VHSVLAFSSAGAQQSDANTPASKEDVDRHLTVMHPYDMMTKMVDAMATPMHTMIHMYVKDKDKLPADFEQKEIRIIDDMYKNMPFDDMLEARCPFTKNISPRVTLIL
jgi:hypothetical protein